MENEPNMENSAAGQESDQSRDFQNVNESQGEEQAGMRVIKGLKIDPLIFTHRFVKTCDICICSGECCYYGVYTESTEHEKIMQMKDRISRSMDDSQTKNPEEWFEEPVEDEDFSTGIAVGTQVYNGKCVFLDRQGYCTLQKIAMEEGENKWKYKPLYCILFPLVITDGVFSIDDDHLGRMHYCNKSEIYTRYIFDVFREEIIHVFGEDGYQELVSYREEYLKNKPEGEA